VVGSKGTSGEKVEKLKYNFVKILTVLLLPFWVLSCSSTPPISMPSETLHPVDEDEILVLDPPADYLHHLEDLGIEIVDVTKLFSVGDELYHLRIKDGAHPFEMREKHKNRFPDVVVDAHHHYEHHARKVDRSYNARKAANWVSGGNACVIGIRIGVVDSVVDVNHEAFEESKITYRSFHLKGEKVSKSNHGTAVTSIISGHGQ